MARSPTMICLTHPCLFKQACNDVGLSYSTGEHKTFYVLTSNIQTIHKDDDGWTKVIVAGSMQLALETPEQIERIIAGEPIERPHDATGLTACGQ